MAASPELDRDLVLGPHLIRMVKSTCRHGENSSLTITRRAGDHAGGESQSVVVARAGLTAGQDQSSGRRDLKPCRPTEVHPWTPPNRRIGKPQTWDGARQQRYDHTGLELRGRRTEARV